jgi:hypothetical protein
MMWRELSQSLYPNCTFFAPSSVQQIEEAQAALSVVIPSELKSLLLESDGIVDEWKQGPILPAAKSKT